MSTAPAALPRAGATSVIPASRSTSRTLPAPLLALTAYPEIAPAAAAAPPAPVAATSHTLEAPLRALIAALGSAGAHGLPGRPVPDNPLLSAVLAWARRLDQSTPANPSAAVEPAPPNFPPTAVNDGPFYTSGGGPVTLTYAQLVGNDTDFEGINVFDNLSVGSVTAITGTVVNNTTDRTVNYTPPAIDVVGSGAILFANPDFAVDDGENPPQPFTIAKGGSITFTYAQLTGNDSMAAGGGFNYQVKDSGGLTSANTATVGIIAVYSGVEAGLTVGPVSASFSTGTVVNDPLTKTVTYTPPAYYSGRVTLDYQVRGPAGETSAADFDTATVIIDIEPAEAVITAENLNLGDIAFSPDGTRIYAAQGSNSVVVLDAATLEQISGFSVTGTSGIAVTPDGLAYSVDWAISADSGLRARDALTAEIVDLSPGLLIDHIPLPGTPGNGPPNSIWIRGGFAFISYPGFNNPDTVTVVDLGTKAVASNVPISDVPAEFAGYAVGNGRRYVVDDTGLVIIDPKIDKVVQRVDIGPAVDVMLTPDGAHAYVRTKSGSYVVLALTAPDPAPAPDPTPNPTPTPDPAPAPDPTPNPTPNPTPAPDTGGVTRPGDVLSYAELRQNYNNAVGLGGDGPVPATYGEEDNEQVLTITFGAELEIPGRDVYVAAALSSFDYGGVRRDVVNGTYDLEFAPIVGVQKLIPGTTATILTSGGEDLFYYVFSADPGRASGCGYQDCAARLQAALAGIPGISNVTTRPYPPPPPPPPPVLPDPDPTDPDNWAYDPDYDPNDPAQNPPDQTYPTDPTDPGNDGVTDPGGGNQDDPQDVTFEKVWENLGKQIGDIGDRIRQWQPPRLVRVLLPSSAAWGTAVGFAWDRYVGTAYAAASESQDIFALWKAVYAGDWNEVGDELKDLLRTRQNLIPSFIPDRWVDPIFDFIERRIDQAVDLLSRLDPRSRR